MVPLIYECDLYAKVYMYRHIFVVGIFPLASKEPVTYDVCNVFHGQASPCYTLLPPFVAGGISFCHVSIPCQLMFHAGLHT